MIRHVEITTFLLANSRIPPLEVKIKDEYVSPFVAFPSNWYELFYIDAKNHYQPQIHGKQYVTVRTYELCLSEFMAAGDPQIQWKSSDSGVCAATNSQISLIYSKWKDYSWKCILFVRIGIPSWWPQCRKFTMHLFILRTEGNSNGKWTLCGVESPRRCAMKPL